MLEGIGNFKESLTVSLEHFVGVVVRVSCETNILKAEVSVRLCMCRKFTGQGSQWT